MITEDTLQLLWYTLGNLNNEILEVYQRVHLRENDQSQSSAGTEAEKHKSLSDLISIFIR